MISSIDLKNAKKEYDCKNYESSLEIYEKLYEENSQQFEFNDLISYCWAIYQTKVKNATSEYELFDAVDFITNLIPQSDLNYSNTCPYTFSMFKLIEELYYEKDYFNLEELFDKINPLLLDEKPSRGKNKASRREKFYNYASKTYLECGEFEKCIEISKDALKNITRFTGDNKVWFKWRIAKSLRQLNQNQEALTYLTEVIKVRKDWYVKKEMAENYLKLNDTKNAMQYLGQAVTTKDPSSIKVNLHYLIYESLCESEPEIAFKHAELCFLLKLENNSFIPEDIAELDINEEELDKSDLEDEIWRYWYDLTYNKKVEYGTISEVLDNDSGYIISNNLESIYFDKSDFNGDYIKEGMYVSFFTEKDFVKSLNKEVVKAIEIYEE
jgi:tetratricopeptide (TPR) repeat protein